MAYNSQQQAYINMFGEQVQKVKRRRKPTNIFLSAVAGSGKTTTLIGGLNETDTRGLKVLLVAFNKSIVNELKERVKDPDIEIKTFNSIGMGYLYRYTNLNGLGKPSITMNRLEQFEPVEYQEPYNGKTISVSRIMTAVKLLIANGYSYLGGNIISSDGVPLYYDGFEDFFLNIVEPYGEKKNYPQGFIHATYVSSLRLLRLYTDLDKINSQNIPTFDFDDQLWIPVDYRTSRGAPITTKKYDIILVDEAQDMSVINSKFLASLLKRNGLFVGIGDRGQAIYQFRGADHNSVDNIIEKFDCFELPLSNSYRCATEITKIAASLFPHFGTFSKEKGVVHKYDGIDSNSGKRIITMTNKDDVVIGVTYNDMVEAVGYLFKNGKRGFFCPELSNRFDRESIEKSIKIVSDTEANSITYLQFLADATSIELAYEYDDENVQADAKRKSRHASVIEIFQPFICPGDDTRVMSSILDDIEDFIQSGAKYSYGDVRMTSVHKSKGKEYRRVMLFLPYNRMSAGSIAGRNKVFKNLYYVGVTRAIEELSIVYSK